MLVDMLDNVEDFNVHPSEQSNRNIPRAPIFQIEPSLPNQSFRRVSDTEFSATGFHTKLLFCQELLSSLLSVQLSHEH